MLRFSGRSGLLLFLFGVMFLSGCHKEQPYEAPPPDSRPSIRRAAPLQPSALVKAGESVKIDFVLTDNQQLEKWKVREIRRTNVRYENGEMVSDVAGDNVILEAPIEGTEYKPTYAYTVPAEIAKFTRIDLWAYVWDNKGNKDSTLFIVTADFERMDTLAQFFSILDYSVDTALYSQAVDDTQSAFNLIARDYAQPGNIPAMDVQEISTSANNFLKQLSSPNNGTVDSVFVVLTPAEFNYDSLTYSTMRQAFYGNVPSVITRPLQVGDIVILRLTVINVNYNSYHHFAALRIVSIDETNKFMTFEYKRSQNNN